MWRQYQCIVEGKIQDFKLAGEGGGGRTVFVPK
jgi:hypothetical protein